MTILVTGSRAWTDWAMIYWALERYPPGTILVHGDARGADKIAGHIGRALGFDVREYPAQWGQYGLKAGPIRNREMLDKERPEVVLAFPLGVSRGTGDCVTAAMDIKRPWVKRVEIHDWSKTVWLRTADSACVEVQ